MSNKYPISNQPNVRIRLLIYARHFKLSTELSSSIYFNLKNNNNTLKME